MEKTEAVMDANLIYSVVKALDVLECLASADRPLSAREVSSQKVGAIPCGCPSGRAQGPPLPQDIERILQNAKDGQYEIGTRVLSLGKSLLDRLDLPEIARIHLQDLSQTAQETVHLTILDDTELLYIAKVEGSQPVRMHCAIGTRNPLYCTAMGKAILAFLPDEQRMAPGAIIPWSVRRAT